MFTVGKISDKYGRKYLLLLSVAGTAVSYFLLLYSCDIWFLFASRIVVGLLKNTETSCYSMVSDISSPSIRVKRMSWIGSAVGLGFIIGPALSGFLTSNYFLELPTYFSCGILALTLLLTILVLPESKSFIKTQSSPPTAHHKENLQENGTENGKESFKENDSEQTTIEYEGLNDELIDDLAVPADMVPESDQEVPQPIPKSSTRQQFSSLKDLFTLFVHPNPLRTLVWVYFLTTMGISIFHGSSSILMQMMGITVQVSSWIAAYSGCLSVASSFVLHWLTGFWNERQLLTRSVFVLSFALLWTFLVSPNLFGLLVIWIPLILGSRILKNCLMGLITHQTHHSQTGTVMGLLNSLESLCRALAPLIGGILMQASIRLPALIGGMLNLAMFIFIALDRPMLKVDQKSEA